MCLGACPLPFLGFCGCPTCAPLRGWQWEGTAEFWFQLVYFPKLFSRFLDEASDLYI